MKKLKQFNEFNVEAFLKDKVLRYISEQPNYIFVDGKRTENFDGLKISAVIIEDNTDYGNGETGLNVYEKINIKLPGVLRTNLSPEDDFELINATAKLYGDYNNLLSLSAEGVQLIEDDEDWEE
ncbi:hypothetical protein [Lactococcus lactis]